MLCSKMRPNNPRNLLEMKAVILAGGLGTRLSEETTTKPKPMVEIGGRPILWHLMKIYARHGVTEFIICCGYKGYVIKEFFANYFIHSSDVTFDLAKNAVEIHGHRSEPWKVTVVDTGDESMTGGRLRRVQHFLSGEDCFCFTYGDGLTDLDIRKSIDFHRSHGKLATVASVSPPGRFGALDMDPEDLTVKRFFEKPSGDGGRINGGFFVLSPSVISHVAGDHTVWEQEPLMKLAAGGQLMAYPHDGFWQPMDTLRDKLHLEQLWASGRAPWKVWED